MIKVLIVDDHELVRTGLKKLLADFDDIQIIGEASSGEEALKLVREKKPHIVLMDLFMQGIGGIEAMRRVNHISPDVKVIALTSCDESLVPTRVLQAGAAGYLTKTSGVQEILQAIRKVHSGQRYVSSDIAQQMVLQDAPNNEAELIAKLSDRELQVMMMITTGKKVQEIAVLLCVSPKTVNSYRYRIFEKLNVKSDVELTHLAIRYGMINREIIEQNGE